jgi:hypothetical protein
MSTDKIETIGAVSSILSGLVWLALTPCMATIGICGGSCSSWEDQPLVVRTLGRVVADQGWLSFAAPDTLYFSYGRFFFLVYVLVILGLMALDRAQIQRVAQQSRRGNRAYQVLLVSLVVAALGDFTSYGIGVFSEAAWRVGFGIEMVAWFGIMLGALLYGIALLQRRAVHPTIVWLLIVAALLMPATFFDKILVQYAPNAQLLPFAVVWPIVGVYLLASRRSGSIGSKR